MILPDFGDDHLDDFFRPEFFSGFDSRVALPEFRCGNCGLFSEAMSFMVGLLGEGFSQDKMKAPDVTTVIVKVLYGLYTSNFGFIWILVLFELPQKNHGVS